MSIKTVLVTGGAGFIGSHIVEGLLETYPEIQVRVLDNFQGGHRHNLPPSNNVRLFEGSILDETLVAAAANGVDTIFHLAAMVSVSESVNDPRACLAANVNGTLNVLEAARHSPSRPRVVFSSSSAVYGDGDPAGNREDAQPQPQTPYGITKLDGELYLAFYRQHHNVSSASLRYFNVYGPRQDPSSEYAAVVCSFVQAASAGRPLLIYGKGSQTRDFIFVRDVARANIMVAENRESSGPFNVATGTSARISELAELVIEEFGAPSERSFLPQRAGDIHHSVADVSRFAEQGFQAMYSLRQGLKVMREEMVRSQAAGSK